MFSQANFSTKKLRQKSYEKKTCFTCKDNNGKLLVEVSIVTFFDAVAIVERVNAKMSGKFTSTVAEIFHVS